MAFQQLIAGKVKLNGIGGIRRHLQERERVKTNQDINLSRSHLNYCIDGLTPNHLISRVNSRIKQLNLKKRPRSNAVGIEDIIIGASTEFMLQLGADKRNQYFADALHFLQNRYGKENVMYCQCHMDESNPHIHVGIVPVTSDGRLSAKSLFSPKTLEQLQTDFYREVSQHYGLERGEHHAKKYLPLQQFKAKQAKATVENFSSDLQTAQISIDTINKINNSAHFVTSGVFFSSENKEKIELPTQDFLTLKNMAEQGVKALAQINILKDDIEKLRRDDAQTNSDLQYFIHQLTKLEKETAKYSAVPQNWRKHIDESINNWQKFFTNYCHDFNRAIVRVFIATHGDLAKTEEILRPFFPYLNIQQPQQYITSVIAAAKIQLKKNFHPTVKSPTWKLPKPSDTDYQKSDELGIVSMQLSSIPDVNWEMINWDLLSELDKDEIRHKQILNSL